jgi:cellulose synthase (UDP-forming)
MSGEIRRKNRSNGNRYYIVIFAISSSAYFFWRFFYTLEGANPITALMLLSIEIYTLLSAFAFLFIFWNRPEVSALSKSLHVSGIVDVLVPTYNEPFEVIAPAIAAAKNIRGVRDVIVLDDGARTWVAELARELNVSYRSRLDRTHAKAGNLNAALAVNNAEFILILDCDHIAKPEMVETLLPYFEDEKVALVQTPQNFYNFKSFQHYYHTNKMIMEEDLFYLGLLAGRDSLNATFWCGTGALIRTAALRDIGGVPTTSITEDILATIKMHKRGWKTRHHGQILARGLAAQNIDQYQAQRYRWGVGAMQVLRSESIVRDKNLSLKQKVSYMATLLGWFDSWKTLFAIVLPGIVMATGWEPISDKGLTAVVVILGYFLLGQYVIHHVGHGLSSFSSTMIFELTRLPATLAATLAIFSTKPRRFTVTQKQNQNETSMSFRAHFLIDFLIIALLITLSIGVVRYWVFGEPIFSSNWVAIIVLTWVITNIYLLSTVKIRIQSKRFGTTRRFAGRIPILANSTFNGVDVQLNNVSASGVNLGFENMSQELQESGEFCVVLENEEFILIGNPKSLDVSKNSIGIEWDEKDRVSGAKLFAKAVILGMNT